jgi:hypothetical protein
MSYKRLNRLTHLLIEIKLFYYTEFEKLINDFAIRKFRKVNFV